MKDTQLNPLSENQRKLLRYGVVLMLVIFLAGWFYFTSGVKNTSVYLKDSTLQVFDDSVPFTYPDNLELHEDYLLIVQPEKQKTHIVNLKTRKTEKIVDKALLDYADGKMLYNKGAETYVDEKALGVLCEQGVIRFEADVLCVSGNSILSINSATNKQRILYTSDKLITEISLLNNDIYLGAINPESKQSYIVREGIEIPVPNVVNIIYGINGIPYFASLKGALNPETVSSYQIEENHAVLQNKDKVVFYK